MGSRKTGDGPGHADRKRAVSRFLRIGVALRIEEHSLARGSWRGLAVVYCDIAPLAGEMDYHEPPATDVACARISNREGKTDRDRRVDRIAAAVENLSS